MTGGRRDDHNCIKGDRELIRIVKYRGGHGWLVQYKGRNSKQRHTCPDAAKKAAEDFLQTAAARR
jgi:hypothetical protein